MQSIASSRSVRTSCATLTSAWFLPCGLLATLIRTQILTPFTSVATSTRSSDGLRRMRSLIRQEATSPFPWARKHSTHHLKHPSIHDSSSPEKRQTRTQKNAGNPENLAWASETPSMKQFMTRKGHSLQLASYMYTTTCIHYRYRPLALLSVLYTMGVGTAILDEIDDRWAVEYR